ncbi:MAG: precorrin-8X methylmutase, partial [Epulopiscium sp.]|nr:precorrin-8X methylmutase [Candidatus Epulonipiscium sp.]
MLPIEKVLPWEIEKRSFEIITEELGDIKLDEEQAPIIKRVIHTTADFEYAKTLTFSESAITRAKDVLRKGACIVTDTQMGKSGINKALLAQMGGEVFCFMSDEDVALEAKERGVTRAVVSMERGAKLN